LRKAFNVREGIKPADSRVSGRALDATSLSGGPLKGITLDMEGMREEFFKTVGWDITTGGPTAEKMKELGI
ncbi:MAG: aldehyde ferredoxin oxidoreductase, partial [Desulfobacteraceae bacterium]